VESAPIDVPGTIAFEHFYRSEYGSVVRVVFGITGRWAVAEEMAQESMLAAHRNWERVGALDRPDLWLRRVAINRAISARRRLSAELSALTRVRAGSDRTEVLAVEDQFVWLHVQRLPRRQAAVLVLWAVEQRTLAEIGEVLGCSDETARTHLRRARARLQAWLETEEDHDEHR
jgi:RNA polymerase sigma-70 factor (ECF subfamily)